MVGGEAAQGKTGEICLKTYTTKSGDLWDQIAHTQLGSVNETPRLIEANRAYRNIYIFPSGVVLNLPEPVKTVSQTLPPWKRKGASE